MADVSEYAKTGDESVKWWCTCEHHEDEHHLIPDHHRAAGRTHYCDRLNCQCERFEPLEPVEDECPPPTAPHKLTG